MTRAVLQPYRLSRLARARLRRRHDRRVRRRARRRSACSPRCAGLLTGYLGKPEIGEAALRALAAIRAANPDAAYACDPVIGDVGRGSYVAAGRRRILPRPRPAAGDHRDAERLRARMADRRAGCGPRRGAARRSRRCARADRASSSPSRSRSTTRRPTRSTCSPADEAGLWRLRTPKLPIAVNGAGDLFAALFFHHWLETRLDARGAVAAASSVFGDRRRDRRRGVARTGPGRRPGRARPAVAGSSPPSRFDLLRRADLLFSRRRRMSEGISVL